MELHEILKAKRKELLMTQEQVAEKIFVSQKSVSNWETQKTYPDIESLIRLAHLYDLSLDRLLLEGSDVVKEIKVQTELSEMRKLSIPPLITNISLVLLLVTQKWWGHLSTAAIFFVVISIFSNFVPLFYFRKRADHIKYDKDKLNEVNSKRWLIIALLIIIIILSIGTIFFIPKLF